MFKYHSAFHALYCAQNHNALHTQVFMQSTQSTLAVSRPQQVEWCVEM